MLEVGRLRVVPVSDGLARLPPGYFGNVDWQRHRALLGPVGTIDLPIGTFLVHGNGRTVLVDAGVGPLVLASGTDRAYLLGDAVHCPAQLQEPDWVNLSDVDPALAAATGRRCGRSWRAAAPVHRRPLPRPGVRPPAARPGPALRRGRVAVRRKHRWTRPALPHPPARRAATAAAASLAVYHPQLGLGASGAIFGVAGGLVPLWYHYRASIGRDIWTIGLGMAAARFSPSPVPEPPCLLF